MRNSGLLVTADDAAIDPVHGAPGAERAAPSEEAIAASARQREDRRRRFMDITAGVVACGAAVAVIVNALVIQKPPAHLPVADKRPLTVPLAPEKPRPVRSSSTAPASGGTSSPTGGATNGNLGYLAVRTTVTGTAVPMVPALPVAGNMRPQSDIRVASADGPRAPLAAHGNADVTGALRPPAEITASPRILAVQKALSRLGYGPIKADGLPGAETRTAIARFQRDRKLTADGEISDRLVKELAAVTGTAVQ